VRVTLLHPHQLSEAAGSATLLCSPVAVAAELHRERCSVHRIPNNQLFLLLLSCIYHFQQLLLYLTLYIWHLDFPQFISQHRAVSHPRLSDAALGVRVCLTATLSAKYCCIATAHLSSSLCLLAFFFSGATVRAGDGAVDVLTITGSGSSMSAGSMSAVSAVSSESSVCSAGGASCKTHWAVHVVI